MAWSLMHHSSFSKMARTIKMAKWHPEHQSLPVVIVQRWRAHHIPRASLAVDKVLGKRCASTADVQHVIGLIYSNGKIIVQLHPVIILARDWKINFFGLHPPESLGLCRDGHASWWILGVVAHSSFSRLWFWYCSPELLPRFSQWETATLLC